MVSEQAKKELKKLSTSVVKEFLRQAVSSNSKIGRSNARLFKAELKKRGE